MKELTIKEKSIQNFKMTNDLYEDVKIVNEIISYLQGTVDMLEKECIERDKGKVATELFIHINGLKREVNKLLSESEWILQKADIDHYGQLSKYVRPYLGF